MLYLCLCLFCVFFFKQKTAYEMRISDWSSDVCSSDLMATFAEVQHRLRQQLAETISPLLQGVTRVALLEFPPHANVGDSAIWLGDRSEERRVGKECVSTCRSRW